MKKPRIGLISFSSPLINADFSVMWNSYIAAIQDAGGLPVLMPVSAHLEDCRTYMDMVDALLVPGGEDMHPKYFGEDPVRQVNHINLLKDEYDLELIRLAREQNKPIFGICRGLQVLNVALGGTLYQDLPSQVPGSISHLQDSRLPALGIHKVKMAPDSILGGILGEEIYTNSFHHQGIKDLAPELRAVGWTGDGIIEAVETADGRIYAVQWHPERMYKNDPAFAGLFTRLMQLAAGE